MPQSRMITSAISKSPFYELPLKALWFFRESSSFRRRRKFRDQTNGNRQFIKLEMRLQENDCAIAPWLAGNVKDIHATFAQGILGLDALRSIVIEQDIIGNPGVEIGCNILPGHEAANLVTHDDLDVMREAGSGQHIRQHS